MMASSRVGLLPRTTGLTLRLPVAAPLRPRARTLGVAQKDLADAILASPEDADIKEVTQQLIQADPELQAQLKRYQEAMARVDRAKSASDELEREYREAMQGAELSEKREEVMQRQQSEQIMADAEVAAAEKLLAAAELRNVLAQQERARLSAELNQDRGRVESSKAACLAVVGGAVGLLPITLLDPLNQAQGLPLVLSLVAAAASCALFGVTYRWAVGSNPQNPHLKGGVVAAFGLVRGAAAADVLQTLSPDGPFVAQVMGTSALYAGQSVLMFGFAAAAIEAAFQQGFIKRIDEQPSV